MDFTAATQGDRPVSPVLGEGPVLLVSHRHRNAMRRAIETTGRQVDTVTAELAPARFETGTATLAVVDVRGSLDEALATVRALAPIADRRGAALIAIVARHDPLALGLAHDAGATHVLESGGGGASLGAVLRSAERFVRRLRARAEIWLGTSAAGVGGARWEWRRGATEAAITPALAEMLGEPSSTSTIALDRALSRVAAEDREAFARGVARLARSALSGQLSHHLTVGGTTRRVAHHVRAHRDAQGRLTRLTAIVEDLDALAAGKRFSARFDPLTGLANAAYARDWIDGLIGGTADFDPACIALMLGLTRFEGINAAYGRAVADGLLQAVARRLRRNVGADRGEARLLARIAGAEFLVAFAGPVRLSEVSLAAQRLLEAFEKPFTIDGRVIHLGCRAGIAVADAETDGADALLRRASAALARAKAGEPGAFEIAGGTGRDDLLDRAASLGDDLRRALAGDGFELVYQPQVEVVGNRIVGVEALVRWRHETLGLLPPQTLVEIAERAEVGPRLSDHILRKALAEASAWPAPLRRLRLSVNATAEDLTAPDYPRRVLSALEEAAFPAQRLTIEVTESGLMRDIGQAARAMSRLRAEGVRIAIDDFGTGYSSLAYLSALPADYLKIDKSLVADLFSSPRDRVVVKGLVDIARSLDLIVIAEGVENDEQRIAAGSAGCQLYQGFLCSRPVDGETLATIVPEWNASASRLLVELADW